MGKPPVKTLCRCAPDPLLPVSNCILCYCPKASEKLQNITEFPVYNKTAIANKPQTCGLTTYKPTKLTKVSSKNTRICNCGKDSFLSGPGWQMCRCPDSVIIPNKKDQYTNFPIAAAPSPSIKAWYKCRGKYALCSMAACQIDYPKKSTSPIGKGLVACGCIARTFSNGLTPFSQVDPIYILDKKLQTLSAEKCPNGSNSTNCGGANNNPICSAITSSKIYNGDYDLVSTYTPSPSLGGFNKVCTKPGVYANCMTAACYEQPAFDGSPITCYCPTYKTKLSETFILGSPKNVTVGCNTQSTGIIYSGVAGPDL